jgi:quercetin dioxygenase-like cupin family protein
MRSSIADLLPEHVLGTLPDQERREMQALAGESPPLRREIEQAAEALARTPERLKPLAPSPAVWARLLQTVGGVNRFAPFLDDLANLFELPIDALSRLLARIDGPQWETSLQGVRLAGAELFHFPVGPRLAATGAAGGVLRVRAGVTFPAHRHHGNETTYVLEGGYLAGGRVYGPGATIEMTAGSKHDYRSAPERDLVIMVLHRGITMLKSDSGPDPDGSP